jgi:hypothetical protein
MFLKGDQMAIENTLERLKREKPEIEKKAQESDEERGPPKGKDETSRKRYIRQRSRQHQL